MSYYRASFSTRAHSTVAHARINECIANVAAQTDEWTDKRADMNRRGSRPAASIKKNAQRVGRSQEFLFAAMRFGQNRHVVATAASQFSHFFLPLFTCAFFSWAAICGGHFFLLFFFLLFFSFSYFLLRCFYFFFFFYIYISVYYFLWSCCCFG